MVFAKAPIPGKVKTRLGRKLGMRNAARIYQDILYNFLQAMVLTDNVTVQLWCYPDSHHPFFHKCARDLGIVLKRQTGDDLGARMLHAFKANLSFDFCVLTGSDIPGINSVMVRQSVTLLKNRRDVVFLPTEDGGYGLIALTGPCPALFRNMKWSTEKVLQQTISRARRRGLVYSLLTSLPDIDNKSDYINYLRPC